MAEEESLQVDTDYHNPVTLEIMALDSEQTQDFNIMNMMQHRLATSLKEDRPGSLGPSDERLQELMQRFFDKEGGLKDQWEGKNAPTQKDIYNLWDEPTQSTVDAFNRQFGQGAAEKILRDGSTDPIPRDKDE